MHIFLLSTALKEEHNFVKHINVHKACHKLKKKETFNAGS
jgi:hypothetical protein